MRTTLILTLLCSVFAVNANEVIAVIKNKDRTDKFAEIVKFGESYLELRKYENGGIVLKTEIDIGEDLIIFTENNEDEKHPEISRYEARLNFFKHKKCQTGQAPRWLKLRPLTNIISKGYVELGASKYRKLTLGLKKDMYYELQCF